MSNPFFDSELYSFAFERACEHLDNLPSRKVAPEAAAIERLDELHVPLSDEGTEPLQVIEELNRYMAPATVAMSGPRYFGFVIGGTYPVSLAANWLAGAWDQATGIYRVTPGTATIEQVALDWLVDLFDFPAGTSGGIVTGATVANFTALAAARNATMNSVGWDVEAKGLIGAPDVDVIVGDEFHPSVMKSLGMVGLGRNRVKKLPVDDQGRIVARDLPAVDKPTIVCLQAGNVNTGSFDPFAAIIQHFRSQSHGHRVWVHVDGAFGLWAAANPEFDELTEGLNLADSWATDAHKWLNVPYDSGCVFVRDFRHVEAAMAITAEYLPTQTTFRNPSDYTPELSRRARGLEIWATLKHLGRQGVAELVGRCCRHARMFAALLQDAGFEILNDVVLNQALVSFGSPQETHRVIEEIQQDGTCWCGGTVWQDRTAMRISTSNWATSDDDVVKSAEAMIRIAKMQSANA